MIRSGEMVSLEPHPVRELTEYISVDKKINDVDRVLNLEKNFDDMIRII